MYSYRQLLINVRQGITNIEKETHNGFSRMDASLGKLASLEHQVASAAGYSISNLWKMDGLETQLREGMEHLEYNFGLISSGIDNLGDSIAPMRPGLDELITAYNSTYAILETSVCIGNQVLICINL